MRRILISIALAALLMAPSDGAASPPATDPLQDAFAAYGNTGEGWTGGDGAYSVPLPDGRTAWLFSDTFLGPVNPDGSRPSWAPLVRNSIVVEDAGAFSTRVGSDALGRPRAIVDTPDQTSWYWMGDGTVQDGELRIVVFHFVAVPGPLLFQQIGVALARFSLPDLTLRGVTQLPQAFLPGEGGGPVSYGSAILERGDYDYVYGVEDLRSEKYLHVARTPHGDLNAAWEYWTGSAWSSLPVASARLLSGVANELSVSAFGGRFVLVAQDHAIGRDILAYDAPAPWGPFSNGRVVYTTPETGGNIVTYNAKAHPGRGPPGTLLIGYNVNSASFGDLFADVTIYRPRFVDVPFE